MQNLLLIEDVIMPKHQMSHMLQITKNMSLASRLGLAFVAAMCTKYKVAVVEDAGLTFEGASTLSHEIGHL